MCVLKAMYRLGYQYKKAGVLCLDLVPGEEKQASLFDRRTSGAGRKSVG